MIKNIVNTFFFRSINAVLSFIIVIVTARYLGAEIRGEISLFVLNVTLVFQVVSVISGGGLVYYASKRPLSSLILNSTLWAILATFVGVYALYFFGFVEGESLLFLLLATLLLSWFYIGMNIIVGFEKIITFNIISSIQMLLLTSLLITFINTSYFSGFDSWLFAYIISFISGLFVVSIVVFKLRKKEVIQFQLEDFKKLFAYGKWAQLANIAQLLNYRLGYYLLEFYTGKAALGVYSSAVAIAEGVWLISKSFSMVVFARVSNMESRAEALQLSFQFARISLYFSLLFIIGLLLLPASFYLRVFGNEFSEIKPLLILLSPGVAVFALSSVYAHYFSGTARPKISSYSSATGLLVTLLLGLWLIPIYASTGVAITASISFISSGVYLVIMIMKEPGAKLKELLPQSNDFTLMLKFLKIKSR
jgi:O-antigen/teichoic acid export membrane protein